MVLSGSLGWVRIAAPQAAARAACLAVTSYMHLMHPDAPLRNLDAQAEAAIRALENGAASVNIIDDLHRVDRGCPAPPALDGRETATLCLGGVTPEDIRSARTHGWRFTGPQFLRAAV